MEDYVLVDNGRITEKEARLNMEQCADFLARMIQKYGPEIQGGLWKQITGKNVYQFFLDFDTLYGRMTDLEKKQFMRTFIESIELYPEKKENASRIPA